MLKLSLIFVFAASLPLQLSAQNKHINLGPNVNSSASELSPKISADGQTLYFIRDDYEGNNYGPVNSQDVYKSTLNADGAWSVAVNMGKVINTGQKNSIGAISVDNNTFIVRGVYDKNGARLPESGWSVINKLKNGYSNPEHIEISNYQQLADKGKFNTFCLASNGKVILMSFSNREDSEFSDLYVSFKKEKKIKDDAEDDSNPNSATSEPEAEKKKKINFKKIASSVKNTVNSGVNSLKKQYDWTDFEPIKVFATKGITETTPFLSPDMRTLYFSSNRKGTLGSNDIWKSTRLDDTWQNWSEPVNLGPEVNTPAGDSYYTIDAKGEYAYMTSTNKSFGRGDIVKVKLSEAMRPNPVVLIKGKVFNAKTKEPMGAGIMYEDLSSNTNVGIAQSDPQTGDYQIALPYGVDYGFLASTDKFIAVSDHIDLKKVDKYLEIKKDLFLIPIEVGATVRLNNIFFDFAKSTLRSSSFSELDRLYNTLQRNPNLEIELGGHTDNVGKDAENLLLSKGRVNAVLSYLTGKGIAASRIKAVGYGETKPVAANDKEEGRQLNRRVEFTVIKN